MHGKFISLLAITAILFSCQEKAVLPKSKMVDVLTDVMLLEAGNQVQYNYGNIPGIAWDRDYVVVCKKNGIDTTQFRQAMGFLEKKPEKFAVIMEEVITRLQKMEMKANAVKK